jgi:hypothetical protein
MKIQRQASLTMQIYVREDMTSDEIMVDNLKSAVLQRLAGAAPVFNPRYLDFARHHGFAIEASRKMYRGSGLVKRCRSRLGGPQKRRRAS